MIEERVAILESKLDRNEKDITKLFDFLREHAVKEEKNRTEFIGILSKMDIKLNAHKSFWAGMVFAFTGVGALIATAINWLTKTGSG